MEGRRGKERDMHIYHVPLECSLTPIVPSTRILLHDKVIKRGCISYSH